MQIHDTVNPSPPAPPGKPSHARQLAAAAYFLVGVSGLFLLAWRRDDPFVRFHALQSVLATVAGVLLGLILRTLGLLPIIGFLYLYLLKVYLFFIFLYWLYLMVRAWQGDRYKIPYLGRFADRQIV